jgi:hypothetical protein
MKYLCMVFFDEKSWKRYLRASYRRWMMNALPTMTERDGAKTIGLQHFSIIVASSSTTAFKQGSRLPISTGGTNSSSEGANSGVQYREVGQEGSGANSEPGSR